MEKHKRKMTIFMLIFFALNLCPVCSFADEGECRSIMTYQEMRSFIGGIGGTMDADIIYPPPYSEATGYTAAVPTIDGTVKYVVDLTNMYAINANYTIYLDNVEVESGVLDSFSTTLIDTTVSYTPTTDNTHYLKVYMTAEVNLETQQVDETTEGIRFAINE